MKIGSYRNAGSGIWNITDLVATRLREHLAASIAARFTRRTFLA